MHRKLISSTLVVALLNLLGCYSSELVSLSEYKQIEEEDEPNNIIVKTKFSKIYNFSESTFYIENDTLFGTANVKELPVGGKIPLSEIETINTKSFSMSVPNYQKLEAKSGKPDEIYVIKYNSRTYHFIKNDYYIQNDTLFGKGKLLSSEREQKIALSDIESIQIEYFDGGKTTLLIVGIVTTLIIIGIIIASNMNFGIGLDLGEL